MFIMISWGVRIDSNILSLSLSFRLINWPETISWAQRIDRTIYYK